MESRRDSGSKIRPVGHRTLCQNQLCNHYCLLVFQVEAIPLPATGAVFKQTFITPNHHLQQYNCLSRFQEWMTVRPQHQPRPRRPIQWLFCLFTSTSRNFSPLLPFLPTHLSSLTRIFHFALSNSNSLTTTWPFSLPSPLQHGNLKISLPQAAASSFQLMQLWITV